MSCWVITFSSLIYNNFYFTLLIKILSYGFFIPPQNGLHPLHIQTDTINCETVNTESYRKSTWGIKTIHPCWVECGRAFIPTYYVELEPNWNNNLLVKQFMTVAVHIYLRTQAQKLPRGEGERGNHMLVAPWHLPMGIYLPHSKWKLCCGSIAFTLFLHLQKHKSVHLDSYHRAADV